MTTTLPWVKSVVGDPNRPPEALNRKRCPRRSTARGEKWPESDGTSKKKRTLSGDVGVVGRFAVDVTLSTPSSMMTSNEISMMMFDVQACCNTTPNHIKSLDMKMTTAQRDKLKPENRSQRLFVEASLPWSISTCTATPHPPLQCARLGGVGLALADPPRPAWLGSLKILY